MFIHKLNEEKSIHGLHFCYSSVLIMSYKQLSRNESHLYVYNLELENILFKIYLEYQKDNDLFIFIFIVEDLLRFKDAILYGQVKISEEP